MNRKSKEVKFLCLGLIGALLFFLASNILIINKVLAKGEAYQDLKIFSEVLSLVQNNYVEEVKPEDLVEGAIVGMLRTLDPHSAFMNPDIYKEMQVETEGKFGGIGIEITIKDDQLTVVAPIEETPAEKAGIKAADRIIKVNGAPTKGMSLIDAVHKMRGPRGTEVTITIMRDEFKKPKDFVITRATIKIKSVKWNVKEDKIGYIRITNFNKTTGSELEETLKGLEKKKMKGLILDLRNNPGGLLDQAVGVTDFFLEKGELIVYTKGRKENQNLRFSSRGKKPHPKNPMVILVNAGSASASEIVAGALQDKGRAVIVGTKTFGKGSVQTIIPLSNGSGLRLTTAKYYTPKGRSIHEKGIEPDILVENIPPGEKESKTRVIREKELKKHLKGETLEGDEGTEKPAVIGHKIPEESKDMQLQKAIDILKNWDTFKKTSPIIQTKKGA
jgi:carboxyl-terminal processing protease